MLCQNTCCQYFYSMVFSLLDNDPPTLSTTTTTPVEGTNVTLTCTPKTTDQLDGYTWYKDNQKISGATGSTYLIPNQNRADDGKYSCSVTTKDLGSSQNSSSVTIGFKCKLN